MMNIEDIKEIYVKAINATIYGHGNYDSYTQKQQKDLLELKASIEHLEEIAEEKDLDNDSFVKRIDGWIDSIATKFARNVYNLLSTYELEDMDHEYCDGRWEKDNTTYYEILIPTEEYEEYIFVGLTDDSFFGDKY